MLQQRSCLDAVMVNFDKCKFYILCEKQKKKYKQNIFRKYMYKLHYVSMVDIMKI